jgi:rsbT antagonist protein RsbS
MSEDDHVPRVPFQVTHGCLVASLQLDLSEAVLRRFRSDLLERVHATHVKGVILDVGGVPILDAEDFEEIRLTLKMVSLLGASTVLVGLGAGVVSALMDLGVSVEGVRATLDMERAFDLLEQDAGAGP